MLRKAICERVVGGKTPRYMYHGTSKKNVPEIKRRGLTSNGVEKAWDESEDVVYLTNSYKNAFIWGWKVDEKTCVVLRIDTSKLDPELISRDWNAEGDGMFGGRPSPEWSAVDWDHLEGENFEYAGEIPPSAIEFVDCSEAAEVMTEWRKNNSIRNPEKTLAFIDKNYNQLMGLTLPGDDEPILKASVEAVLKELQ